MKRIPLLMLVWLPAVSAFARCGGVDYSWGADALASMHDYVVTMMLYVVYLVYAVASVVAIVAALQIYMKMSQGEEGVAKAVMLLVGSCMFLIGATMVLPAFFGYGV